MKTKYILMLLIAALTMAACSDRISVSNADDIYADDALVASIPGYEEATKVTFPGGLSDFKWSNGDCIAVSRSGSTANGTAVFTLLQGGSKVGNFINDAFSLNPGSEYYAFYPYVAGATSSSLPIDVTGQIQNGNANLEHIGKYSFMSASFTTNETGGASFNFANLCSIIQVHFTAEGEEDYSYLTIESDNVKFPTKAAYNLQTGALSVESASNHVKLSFGEGMHVYNGENITISLVAVAYDMSGSNLTFKIYDKHGVKKEFSFSAYAMASGKVYHFREEDSFEEPPYGGCPDGNHPHMVDLGLPSGTLWACCNLGAETPAEGGVKLSWGQTHLVQKNTSGWAEYEFMDKDSNSEWGINKYQIADEQYKGCWYSADSTFVGDGHSRLLMSDDPARVNWGGDWRLPTKEECDELNNYTYHAWTSFNYNGTVVEGAIYYKKKVSGNYTLRDPHIFFVSYIYRPSYSATYHIAQHIWSSDLNTTTNVHCLLTHGSSSYPAGGTVRWSQNYVRAVCSKKTSGGGDSGDGTGGGGGSSW